MNIKRLSHVLAIMFSSLMSMLSHGHAEGEVTKKLKTNGGGELSKPHRSGGSDASHNGTTGEAGDDPPQHLDPAVMAAAERPSMFHPLGGSIVTAFPTTPTITATPAHITSRSSTGETRYPWRQRIVTTTFWIGETPTRNNPVPNRASSWDPEWSVNYGGFDNPSPDARKDFIPTRFTPKQNPFYVALPYNDMEKTRHKTEAAQVIPWFNQAFEDPTKSVCKGRWIAIRFGNRTAYAQWEDCGPFRTDHWEYVFGNDRPKPNLNHGAGLDVSPAVRDYLGMNDTDVTDWRFVDFEEVPAGPWSRLGDNNTFVINQRKNAERLAKVEQFPQVRIGY